MLITHYMFLNLNSRTTKTINSKKMKLKAVPKLLYNRTTNQHKREKRGRETYWPSCFLLDTPPLPKYLFSSLAWGESQRVTVDAVATSADSEATKEMCNKYKTYKKLHPYTLKHWWLTRPRRKRSITIFVPIITFPRKLKLIFRQVSSAEQNYTRENSFRPLKFWPGALHASCGFGIKCDARSVDGSCKMNFIPLYLLFPSIILLFLYLLYFHSPYFHSPHTHTPKYIRAFSTYTTTPYSLQAYRKTCNLIIFLRQPLRGDSSQASAMTTTHSILHGSYMYITYPLGSIILALLIIWPLICLFLVIVFLLLLLLVLPLQMEPYDVVSIDSILSTSSPLSSIPNVFCVPQSS